MNKLGAPKKKKKLCGIGINDADNMLDARAMYLAHRKEYIQEIISRQKNTHVIRALEGLS